MRRTLSWSRSRWGKTLHRILLMALVREPFFIWLYLLEYSWLGLRYRWLIWVLGFCTCVYFRMGRPRLRLYLFIQSSVTLYLFTCYFKVVYATYYFHWDAYILLLILTCETYLFIFGDHGSPPVYPYLLLENVCLFTSQIIRFYLPICGLFTIHNHYKYIMYVWKT